MAKQEKTMKQKEPIPRFASREEEAAFWDEHDLADYWDDFERVEAQPVGDSTRTASERSA